MKDLAWFSDNVWDLVLEPDLPEFKYFLSGFLNFHFINLDFYLYVKDNLQYMTVDSFGNIVSLNGFGDEYFGELYRNFYD